RLPDRATGLAQGGVGPGDSDRCPLTTPGRMDARKNPWFGRSVAGMALLTLACLLVGFVVLPTVRGGLTAQAIWSSICRAAGVPGASSGFAASPPLPPQATQVILER